MTSYLWGALSYVNPFSYNWSSCFENSTGNTESVSDAEDLMEQGNSPTPPSQEEMNVAKPMGMVSTSAPTLQEGSSTTHDPELVKLYASGKSIYPEVPPLSQEKTIEDGPTTHDPELVKLYTDGKSIYPELPPPSKEKSFRFDGGTDVEDSVDEEGFVAISNDSGSPFKTEGLPSHGIPTPHRSSPTVGGTSKAKLESRKTEGKIVRWWGLFNQSLNGLPLIGYKQFWKAMEAFPFSHHQILIRRDDIDVDSFRQSVSDFDKAHHNYLEALRKPVKVLQSEIAGLSVEDQVSYFDAASKEVTGVKWVKDREWKQEQVERDFKSTALLSLTESIGARIVNTPTEVNKVYSYVTNHLAPFAQIQNRNVTAKDGFFAQPIEHKVSKGRSLITMDVPSLIAYQKAQSKAATAPPLEQQRLQTAADIHRLILDKAAPVSMESHEANMQASQDALANLLNEALKGRPMDAEWKEQVRDQVQAYRFLLWQHETYYPDALASRLPFLKGTIERQLSNASFKYLLVKTTAENSRNKGRYIERVKQFLPIQKVMQGATDALLGQIELKKNEIEALNFNPFSPVNAIQLTKSDL